MHCLITGVDGDGRSCVVEELSSPAEAEGTDGRVGLWPLYRLPADRPPRPEGAAEFLDLRVAPSESQWLICRWPPNSAWSAFHHTDTVDFDLVIEGSIDLRLDDGDHRLVAGDSVVVAGVDHAWQSGPDGCVMSVVALGTPPPGHATA